MEERTKGRKILHVVLSSFLLSSFFLCFVLAQERPHEIHGDTLFNAAAYERLTLRVLRGKVVLLFFWTAHDIASEEAAAELNALYARHAARLPGGQVSGLEIVGIYSPEWGMSASRGKVWRAIEVLGIRFPVLVDDDASLKADYGLTAWPSYCLIDRRGRERHRQSGLWDFHGLSVMLRTLLEEKG